MTFFLNFAAGVVAGFLIWWFFVRPPIDAWFAARRRARRRALWDRQSAALAQLDLIRSQIPTPPRRDRSGAAP